MGNETFYGDALIRSCASLTWKDSIDRQSIIDQIWFENVVPI